MKLLFMLCNRCLYLAQCTPVGCAWVVDNVACKCVFLPVQEDVMWCHHGLKYDGTTDFMVGVFTSQEAALDHSQMLLDDEREPAYSNVRSHLAVGLIRNDSH